MAYCGARAWPCGGGWPRTRRCSAGSPSSPAARRATCWRCAWWWRRPARGTWRCGSPRWASAPRGWPPPPSGRRPPPGCCWSTRALARPGCTLPRRAPRARCWPGSSAVAAAPTSPGRDSARASPGSAASASWPDSCWSSPARPSASAPPASSSAPSSRPSRPPRSSAPAPAEPRRAARGRVASATPPASEGETVPDPEVPREQSDDHRSAVEQARREKLARLRAAGIDAYPVGFSRTHTLAEVAKGWKDLTAGEESGDAVRVAGRIVLKRAMGKLAFWTLRQGDDELQAMLTLDSLGAERFELALDLDLGDWVGLHGVVVRTKRGELSIRAEQVKLLAKSLRPLPDKWKGLT